MTIKKRKIDEIQLIGKEVHSKASEEYIDVIFKYKDGKKWEGLIPIVYRRTGLDFSDDDEIIDYIKSVYPFCDPNLKESWIQEQAVFWNSKPNANVTYSFFEKLTSFEWCCISCGLPENSNPARRIQDIKEFGYTIATKTNKYCPKCKEKKTHYRLVPLKRGGITGYETWSPKLKKRIIKVLGSYDCYEAKKVADHKLIPDHKFSEIRWDENTKRESIENLSDSEIKRDFQLLDNQRNQQKREVCRGCFQSNKRGYPFGISYFYQGNETWDEKFPTTGKEAEEGCKGCGWYDLELWRTSLIKTIRDS